MEAKNEGSAKHTPGPLDDAAIVCERRDEFGHTHKVLAAQLRSIDAAMHRVLSDAIEGECSKIGFAWVPLEALAELRAAIAKATGSAA